jgi:hypothetical protein
MGGEMRPVCLFGKFSFFLLLFLGWRFLAMVDGFALLKTTVRNPSGQDELLPPAKNAFFNINPSKISDVFKKNEEIRKASLSWFLSHQVGTYEVPSGLELKSGRPLKSKWFGTDIVYSRFQQISFNRSKRVIKKPLGPGPALGDRNPINLHMFGWL